MSVSLYSRWVKTLVTNAAAAVALAVTAAGATADVGAAASAVAQAGHDYFETYCAACHGTDAKGSGPAAAALSEPPPDLTRIAERRGGAFPMVELAALIDGRASPRAHGSREMPVWGEQFAQEVPQEAQQSEIVRGKVLMLLVYLQSIQR